MSASAGDLPDDELARLIEQARSGERAALQALLERVREPLLVRIRWMMGAEARRIADSDDFLHSTFAAALPALVRFEDRGSGAFLGWLTTIARNQIRQEVRRRREHVLSELSSALGAGAPSRAEGTNGPISVDTALMLMEAFDQLAEDERRLVELRDLERRSFVEIAALVGCSERQAQRLHGRALLRLARIFRRGASGAE